MTTNITERIIGKIVLQAQIENKTNLLISSGSDEQFDFEVVRDADNKPFIPGSSFAGMLRSYFEKQIDLTFSGYKTQSDYFWGTRNAKETHTYQSHIIIDDLFMSNNTETSSRDGVSIDYATGVADNKYDYEFVPPGASFTMNMEITLREGCDVELIKSFVKFIVEEGEKQKYFQGAFSTHNFGMLEWKHTKVYFFDFKNKPKGDDNQWFKFLDKELTVEEIKDFLLPAEAIPLPEKNKTIRNDLTINATFTIKNNLIIGSPNFDIDTHTDKTHLLAGKEPVITGKSVRGALRHRSSKILKTISPGTTVEYIDSLFGFVDKERNKAKPGRIKAKDVEISATKNHQQNRIKICRLTGKVIEGALMTEQMITRGTFNLVFTVQNYEATDLFILLQSLKDMVQQDLPVGGNKTIGRGILIGEELVIKDDEKEIKWEKGSNKVKYPKEWETILKGNWTDILKEKKFADKT